MPAIDLFRIVCQADRLDDGALLDDRVGALDLQILDQGDEIAIFKHIARRIAYFIRTRRFCRQFGGRSPFTGRLVIHVLVIICGHGRLS